MCLWITAYKWLKNLVRLSDTVFLQFINLRALRLFSGSKLVQCWDPIFVGHSFGNIHVCVCVYV